MAFQISVNTGFVFDKGTGLKLDTMDGMVSESGDAVAESGRASYFRFSHLQRERFVLEELPSRRV